MKVTVHPYEKNVYKAVMWHARKIAPTCTNSFVKTMGRNESISLNLNSKVYFENMSIEPVYKGNPIVTGFEHLAEVYCEIVIEGPLESQIVQFIEKAVAEHEKFVSFVERDEKNLVIVTWDGYHWDDEYRTPKRTPESIYVSEFTNVLEDLKNFYSNSSKYLELEIPYTRTYMLYGLPGTGKTSMIYTIASALDKNLAIIDFSNKELCDSSIRKALFKLPSDTILCLEDIDSLFSQDRKSDKSTITFSGVLNILDGVVKNTGLVIFMTTNNLANMDDTAMRRRVDYYLKFDVMCKTQFDKMFKKFYPGQDSQKFWANVKKLQFTPCILQKFFVRHLYSDDVVSHVDEFIQMCTNEYSLKKSSDALYT